MADKLRWRNPLYGSNNYRYIWLQTKDSEIVLPEEVHSRISQSHLGCGSVR